MRDSFTPESSAAARAKIDEQRLKYRKDYQDDEYWSEVAKGIGERVPPYYARPADQDIKYWLKVCKVPYHQFVDAFGWKDAAEFEELNPTHGMKAIAGLILELMEENRRAKKISRERAYEVDLSLGDSMPPKPKMYVGQSKNSRRAAES